MPGLSDLPSWAKMETYALQSGEGGEPDFAEAELLVGTAAIVATYLARKLK
jgi:hypothetical protein